MVCNIHDVSFYFRIVLQMVLNSFINSFDYRKCFNLHPEHLDIYSMTLVFQIKVHVLKM